MKFFEILVKKYYYFSQLNKVLVYKDLDLDQVGRAMAVQRIPILSGMAFVICYQAKGVYRVH